MKTSGILLPIFSLPSDYGIGCFSKEAYKFVDFLEGSRPELLADPSIRNDRSRKFSLSFVFKFCRKCILY